MLTRRGTKKEMSNPWSAHLIGCSKKNCSRFIDEEPKLPCLEEFVDQTTTCAFWKGKYALWDCLRANYDIVDLKEFKKEKGILEDAETMTYERLRGVVNKAIDNWMKEGYKNDFDRYLEERMSIGGKCGLDTLPATQE
jgi:hypothetical protein